ncbi:MAG TPA: hypothetical protein VF059_13005 [Casimicrobiaceae bacterium]
MSNTMRLNIPQAGELVLAAPRQAWLATLGAAAVTRHWAQKEAATMFRTLVKEGAAVESTAIRRVSAGVDASVRRASRLARSARSGVTASAASLADFATTLVRARLPAMRASIKVESAAAPRKRAAKRKAVKGSSRRRAKSIAAR